jgi:hypothetical protein
MGQARLAIKNKLNYRSGYTSRSCSTCDHFTTMCEMDDPAHPGRCDVVGLKIGRLYRINPKCICDKHDDSRYLARLRGY